MRKFILLILLSLGPWIGLHAQSFQCQTAEPTAAQLEYLKKTAQAASETPYLDRMIRDVAMNIIIIQYADGPLVSPQFVEQRVQGLNTIFAPMSVQFSICNIDYAPFPYQIEPQVGFESWDYPVSSYFLSNYWKAGYMNVFFGRGAGPLATLPGPYEDYILMNAGPLDIFAHEVGHYFNLIHTHAYNGYSPVPLTAELVNGSNCLTDGDFICDTPADPGMLGRVTPAPACQYIDTVTTDANGDLYAPLTNNYMAILTIDCMTDFTPGQFARMRYALDHEMAFLKSGGMNLSMDPLPIKVCISDSALALSSPDPGGVFSGPGVTGNVFNPADAGPGNHFISYALPGTAAILETTDGFFTFFDSIVNTNQFWQSFTPTQSGNFTGISFQLNNQLAQTVTAKLYAGAGTTGTLLESINMNLDTTTGMHWHKFNFGGSTPINAGSIYTVSVESSNPLELAWNTVNRYILGESDKTTDYALMVHMMPSLPPCGEITSAPVFVGQPTTLTIAQLKPQYCLFEDADSVLFSPVGGEIFVNGQPEVMVDPAQLGPGNFQVTYVYENNYGCTSTLTEDIEIPEIVSTGIEDGISICGDSGIYVFEPQPSGGNIYFDGQWLSNNSIDFSQTTPGPHQISYSFPRIYTGPDTLDQENQAIGSFLSMQINSNSTIWQSFRPSHQGYADWFNISLYSNPLVHTYYTLRKGNGANGPILFADSAVFGAQSTYMQAFDFPDYQILLEQDSVYSFTMSFGNVSQLTAKSDYNNTYQRGEGSFSNPNVPYDFKFEFHMNHTESCAADSMAQTVNIAPSFQVDLGPDVSLPSGQSINLDAGSGGTSYLWSTGDTTQSIVVVMNGIDQQIWVQAINAAGCVSIDTISVLLSVGISETEFGSSIMLSPNPAKEQVMIQSVAAMRNIILRDISGRLVHSEKMNDIKQYHLQVNHLSSGVYLLQVDGDGVTEIKKLIIHRD